MKIKLLNGLLILVFTIGIFGAGRLVYSEFIHKDICPKLIGIPACYIILGCFIIPFVAHVFKRSNYIYFSLTGIAFIIALIASMMEITNLGECPKTTGGTPMCYYSLFLFTSLITLKMLILKISTKNL